MSANGNIPYEESKLYRIRHSAAHVMAEAVLLDWEGFEDAEGKPVKFSKKTAEQYLFVSKDFRKDMSLMSGNRDKYLLKNLQDDVEAAKKS